MPHDPPLDARNRPFADILPIQIRDDLVVRIHGIPHDLTEQEAAKISRVITAMAVRNPQREESRDAPPRSSP